MRGDGQNLHGKREGVDDDQDKDAVFKTARRDEPPDLVLETYSGNVATLRLHLQRKFYAFPLQQTPDT